MIVKTLREELNHLKHQSPRPMPIIHSCSGSYLNETAQSNYVCVKDIEIFEDWLGPI